MSPDPLTRESRLRENDAESKLAILRNRVEQHLSSVGKTPDSLIARSNAAITNIEKTLKELRDCASGSDQYDLRSLVSDLENELGPIRARIRWHDQQIEAFAPLRIALNDTKLGGSDDDDADGAADSRDG